MPETKKETTSPIDENGDNNCKWKEQHLCFKKTPRTKQKITQNT